MTSELNSDLARYTNDSSNVNRNLIKIFSNICDNKKPDLPSPYINSDDKELVDAISLKSRILRSNKKQLSETFVFNFYPKNINKLYLSTCNLTNQMGKIKNLIFNTDIFTSTTGDKESVKYLYKFAYIDLTKDETQCCIMKVLLPIDFPRFDVEDFPSESNYHWQNETLLPYNLKFKIIDIKPEKIDLQNFDNKEEKATKTILTYTAQCLVSIILTAELFDEFETIIYQYYSSSKPNYHDERHISVTLIYTILLVVLYLKKFTLDKEDILALMYASIFHDVARKGRDGVDLWEKESATIAYKYLSLKNKELAIKTKLILLESEDENWNNLSLNEKDIISNLHSILKGADSFDISRVKTPKLLLNPFYQKFKHDFEKECEDFFIDTLFLTDVFKNTIYTPDWYLKDLNIDEFLNEFLDNHSDYCGKNFEIEPIFDKYIFEEKLIEQYESIIGFISHNKDNLTQKINNLITSFKNGKNKLSAIYPIYEKYKNEQNLFDKIWDDLNQIWDIYGTFMDNRKKLKSLLELFFKQNYFKKDLPLSHTVIMMDLLSGFTPSLRCLLSETILPYKVKKE
jgi:hypothetical protein